MTTYHRTPEEMEALSKLVKCVWVLTDWENWTEKDRITMIGTREEVHRKNEELAKKDYTIVWLEPAW